MNPLFLARHGETAWNVEGRMQGRIGGELTAKGIEQARSLAGFAKTMGVRRIVASSLRRARDTARIVGDALGIAVTESDGLLEIDFGQCSGVREDAIDERFPGLREARGRDKWSYRWPGGESYEDAQVRVRHLVANGVLDATVPTLVVAHQSVNRVIARVLSGASEADVLAMTQPSDVVLRFGADRAAWHTRIASTEWPCVWQRGLYRKPAPKLRAA